MKRRTTLYDEAGTFLHRVIIDTREQLPYTFERLNCDKADGGGVATIPTVRERLDAGDYSLSGFERKVAVERKSLADLYHTLGQGRERFERELLRLSHYQFAAVVVEATWPQALVPPPWTQLRPKTVFRSINAWKQRWPNVHWDFLGDRRLAEVHTFRTLERFLRDDTPGANERNDPDRWPTLEEVVRRHVLHTYERADRSKQRASVMLGVAVKTVYNRLNEYELRGLKDDVEQHTRDGTGEPAVPDVPVLGTDGAGGAAGGVPPLPAEDDRGAAGG